MATLRICQQIDIKIVCIANIFNLLHFSVQICWLVGCTYAVLVTRNIYLRNIEVVLKINGCLDCLIGLIGLIGLII